VEKGPFGRLEQIDGVAPIPTRRETHQSADAGGKSIRSRSAFRDDFARRCGMISPGEALARKGGQGQKNRLTI